MSEASQEMNLEQWVERLPTFHLVNKQYREIKKELERLREMIGAVVAAGFCPECGDGKGFIVNPLMPDGEPEQVQCMWCDHARRALAEIEEVGE